MANIGKEWLFRTRKLERITVVASILEPNLLLMLSRKTLPSSYQSKIVFCLPPAIKQILRLSIETALRRILRSSAYSSATPKCQISQVPLALLEFP